MKVPVFSTQTILDICLQTTGTVESLFDILKLNNMNSILIEDKRELEVIQPLKQRTVNYYASNNIRPATQLNINNRSFSSDFSFDFN
ncbi:MAG: hypothetical protein HYR91_11080 [Flavobacteriia bacterium]|nr:hypothetical protein [Flavobacteriia bacterium]